ncbi:hypothetical protein BGX38DRAFT_1275342 [Terfezia claveryi]|nr:hypothetical protein BGX38DRAFT_1275342 [Terfezia claveryi]
MQTQAWFRTANPESSWTKVSLVGLDDVDDLREAMQRKMPHTLGGYDPAQLTIMVKYGDKDSKDAVPRKTLRKCSSDLGDGIPHLHVLPLTLRRFGSSSSFHLDLMRASRKRMGTQPVLSIPPLTFHKVKVPPAKRQRSSFRCWMRLGISASGKLERADREST